MKVFWTESALGDLRSIEASIGRHSAHYAESMLERIFSRSAELNEHPLIGPMVTEYGDEQLCELFENPYRIIYRVFDERIEVLTVIHGARRLPRGI